MMSGLTKHRFDDREIRIVDRGNNPWFIAIDVCVALKLSRPKERVAQLDHDERAVVALPGERELTAISESGLYALILSSRDARKEGTLAYRFRSWVTKEVLPTIRKAGSYGADPSAMLNDPKVLRQTLLNYVERTIDLEARNSVLAPKAAAFDQLAGAEGLVNLTNAAKNLGVSRTRLIDWGLERRWWYRQNERFQPAAHKARIDQGLLKQKVVTIEKEGGGEVLTEQMLITAKGLTAIALEMRSDANSLFRRDLVA